MKSDYNKSMLRLGAVVVASASIFGAASSMKAAPVAAPLAATEDSTEPSEDDQNTLQEDNQKAYEAEYGKLLVAEERLTKVLQTVNSDYAEYEEKAAEAAMKINAEIDKFKKDCEDELEAANEEGRAYTPQFNDVQEGDLNDAIDAILEDANGDRVAKNDAAYKVCTDAMTELNKKYTDAIAKSNTYFKYLDDTQKNKIKSDIDDLEGDIEIERLNTTVEGYFVFAALDTRVADIEEAIDTMVSDAEEAMETARVTANQTAYDADIETVDGLTDALKAATDSKKPYYSEIEAGAVATVESMIADLKASADAQLKSVEDDGDYSTKAFTEKFEKDTDAINKAITLLVSKAIEYSKANDVEAYDALKAKYDADTATDTDYYQYLNKPVINALGADIDQLKKDIDAYWTAVKDNKDYDPEFDAQAKAKELTDNLNFYVDKAKEEARVKMNEAAYKAVNDKIQALRDALAEACDAKNDYAQYINRGQKAAIESEIEDLQEEADLEKEKTASAGLYNFGVTDDEVMIQGQINKLVEDAKNAMQKAEDLRVYENNAEYNSFKDYVSKLETELADVTGDEELKPFIDPETEAALTEEIAALKQKGEDAYKAVEKEGVFTEVLGIDIAKKYAEISAKITKMYEAAKAYQADPTAHENAIAYGNDCTKLTDLQQNFTALWETFAQSSPTFYESKYGQVEAEGVYNIIADMQEKVDDAYAAAEEAKEAYVSPMTEAFDQDFESAVDNLQHMAQVFADNDEARKADAAAIEAIMAEVEPLATELDELYPAWMEDEKCKALYDEINSTLEGYFNDVNGAWQSTLKTGEAYQTPYDAEDLDAVKTKMEDLKAMVEQIVYNNTAYGNDITKLSEMQQDLTAMWESFAQSSPAFYESAYGEALAQVAYTVLSDAHEAVETAYAEVEEGGAYVSPLTEAFEQDFNEAVENLQHMAQVFVDNYDAMMADNEAVDKVDDLVFALGDELDALDPEWLDNEEAATLGNDIREAIKDLRSEIEGAYAASLKTGEYISPVSEEVLDDIKTMIDDLRNYVKAYVNNDRVAYNDAAYGAEITLLGALQEELSNTWNQIVEKYPSFEEFGAAIAISSNLYKDLEDMVAACEADYAAVENEGTYPTHNTEMLEQDVRDGIEQLQVLAWQFAQVYDEWQDASKQLEAMNTEVYSIYEELDAKVPDWGEIGDAAALADEIDETITQYLNDLNGAWGAYLRSGDYIAPFEQTDLDALNEKIETLRGFIETSVGTLVFDAEAEYYTLDGQKLSRPVRGMVNIVRKGNSVQKIFVK